MKLHPRRSRLPRRAAGLVVTVLAATTVAVLVTMRVLGVEEMAHSAAPFLAFDRPRSGSAFARMRCSRRSQHGGPTALAVERIWLPFIPWLLVSCAAA